MNLRDATAIVVGGLFLFVGDGVLACSHRKTIPTQHVDCSQSGSDDSSVEKPCLVFVGTVSRIYPIRPTRSRRNWAVVAEVNRLVSGEFSGRTFTFTVHSPARIGLRVGMTYRFEAAWSNGKYVVNDRKWMQAVDGGSRK